MFLKKMKSELKEMAADISASRRQLKEDQRNGNCGNQWSVQCKANDFRLKHIAYCLLRGRTYEQIEPKVRPHNEPRWDKIEKMVEAGRAALAQEAADAEALRASAG